MTAGLHFVTGSALQGDAALAALLRAGIEASGIEASGPTYYLHAEGDADEIRKIVARSAPSAEEVSA